MLPIYDHNEVMISHEVVNPLLDKLEKISIPCIMPSLVFDNTAGVTNYNAPHGTVSIIKKQSIPEDDLLICLYEFKLCKDTIGIDNSNNIDIANDLVVEGMTPELLRIMQKAFVPESHIDGFVPLTHRGVDLSHDNAFHVFVEFLFVNGANMRK